MTRAGGKGPWRSTSSWRLRPGQVFHHVIERAVVGAAVVVDLDGVPVREPGRRPDLALEAGQDPRLAATRLGLISLMAQGRLSSWCSAR